MFDFYETRQSGETRCPITKNMMSDIYETRQSVETRCLIFMNKTVGRNMMSDNEKMMSTFMKMTVR
jgi:hypothetical protein